MSQPSVVKADAPTATSTSGETGATPVVKTPKTEVEKAKEDLTEALKQIPDNELLDKKAKEELLKAVESGELNASDILAELADDAEKHKILIKQLKQKLLYLRTSFLKRYKRELQKMKQRMLLVLNQKNCKTKLMI